MFENSFTPLTNIDTGHSKSIIEILMPHPNCVQIQSLNKEIEKIAS